VEATQRGIRITVVDGRTGKTRWRTRFPTDPAPKEVRLAVAAPEQLAVLTHEGALYPKDGVIHGVTPAGRRWRFPPEPESYLELVTSTTDTVYASSRVRDGLVAVDAATGTERWRGPAPGGEMAIDTDTIYYITGDRDTLLAVRTSDGSIEWELAGREESFDSSPILVGNTIYATTDESKTLYAIDRGTGAVRWRFGSERKSLLLDGLVRRDAVYVETDSTLRSLSPTDGVEQWRVTPPLADAVSADSDVEWGIAGDTAYLSRPDGTLYAYSVADGEHRWSVDTGSTVRDIVPPVTGQLRFPSYEFEQTEWAPSPERVPRVLVRRVPGNPTTTQSGDDEGVQAHDAETGERVWELDAVDISYASPTTVYLEDTSTLYSVDTMDGSINWRFSRDQNREGYSFLDHVTPDTVFYISTRRQEEKWRFYAIERDATENT